MNVLIVAGEASSALYAQRLLEHWKSREVPIQAWGVGSSAMVKLGFEALGRSEDMAVVGLQEVLAHFWDIRKVFKGILARCLRRKPDAALLLDYPGFNLRLADQLKALGVPVVYYISPQVWAWKQGRVSTIRRVVDRLLVVFPFEVEFFKKFGIEATFVGHPLLPEWKRCQWTDEDRVMHRRRFGFEKNDQVLGLMPGSRRSELKYNLQEQLKAAQILLKERPQLKVAWLVAPNFSLEEARAHLPPRLGFSVQLIQSEPFSMIQLCDVMICASGTATLMVGLAQVPMVIMYRMHPVTAWLARRWVKHIPFFGMVNLIGQRQIVPELFQEEASGPGLARAVSDLLQPDRYRQAQKDLSDLSRQLAGGDQILPTTALVAAAVTQYSKTLAGPRGD